jgi:hypothetical protein
LFGEKQILNQDITLYLARLGKKSLAADSLKFNEDGSVSQEISIERYEYSRIFKARFGDKNNNRHWFRSQFPIFPKRSLDLYPSTITSISSSKTPIFASLCSIPSRQEQLKHVVERIMPQVDHLFVFLDKYPEIPSFLLDSQCITVIRSEDYDREFRDNAKFISYNDLKCKYDNFFYITCDDDLDYPYDYVATLIDRLESFSRRAIVGVHGVMISEELTSYNDCRFIYHFQRAVRPHSKLVNILGSGTLAFHSDVFQSIDIRKWAASGMCDIFLSIEARRSLIPMICIDRSEYWLRQQKLPKDNHTLFDEAKKNDAKIFEQITPYAPWGYKSILETISAQPEELRVKLLELLPSFPQQMNLGDKTFRFR